MRSSAEAPCQPDLVHITRYNGGLFYERAGAGLWPESLGPSQGRYRPPGGRACFFCGS